MDNNKLQKSYVYIVLGLLAVTLVAAVYVACRCYPLYSKASPLDAQMKTVLWSLMILPSVILPIALWLSNMLSPTLSKLSLLSVLLTCCFFAAVPRIYGFGDASEMSHMTSAFAFFLIMCTVSVVFRDLRISVIYRLPNIIFGIILTVAFALIAAYVSYFVFNIGFFDRIMISFFVPILCGVALAESAFDIYSGATLILNTVCLGYGTLCASFEAMNNKAVYILFVGLCALTFIWKAIDIIKYIFQRRDKNDSESCNA